MNMLTNNYFGLVVSFVVTGGRSYSALYILSTNVPIMLTKFCQKVVFYCDIKNIQLTKLKSLSVIR